MSEELLLIKQSLVKKSSKRFSRIFRSPGSTFTTLIPFLRVGQHSTQFYFRFGLELNMNAQGWGLTDNVKERTRVGTNR